MSDFGTFSERLSWARKHAGLNQQEMRQRMAEIGIPLSAGWASELESKNKIPGTPILAGLSKVLGVSTDFLLGLTDEDRANLQAIAALTELSDAMIKNSSIMIENSSILVKNSSLILRRLQKYQEAQTKELA